MLKKKWEFCFKKQEKKITVTSAGKFFFLPSKENFTFSGIFVQTTGSNFTSV